MARLTSIETYRQIHSEGLLSQMRLETYSLLYAHGPMTASELLVKGRDIHGMKSQRDNYQKRLGELRDAGVVYEVRERKCTITGRNVIEWDVTDNLPTKLTTKPKRLEILFCTLCRQEIVRDRHNDCLGTPIIMRQVK